MKGRQDDVRKNCETLANAIRAECDEAIASLYDVQEQKLALLAWDEAELKRKLNHMETAEDFLKAQQKSLTPVDFLSSWTRHAAIRKEMSRIAAGDQSSYDEFPSSLVEVEADAILRGSLRIDSRSWKDLQTVNDESSELEEEMLWKSENAKLQKQAEEAERQQLAEEEEEQRKQKMEDKLRREIKENIKENRRVTLATKWEGTKKGWTVGYVPKGKKMKHASGSTTIQEEDVTIMGVGHGNEDSVLQQITENV